MPRTLTVGEHAVLTDAWRELGTALVAAQAATERARTGRAALAYVELDFARDEVQAISELIGKLDALLTRLTDRAQHQTSSHTRRPSLEGNTGPTSRRRASA